MAIIWIMLHTEANFSEMIDYASNRNKFNIMNMELNFTDSTFWVVLLEDWLLLWSPKERTKPLFNAT